MSMYQPRPLNIAIQLIELITKSRGTGNTTLQMNGVVNYNRPFLIVSQNRSHALTLTKLSGNEMAKAASIKDILESSRGQKLPFVLDHQVVFNVLTGMIGLYNKEFARTSALVESIYEATSAIEKMTEISDIYQNQSHTIERLSLELIECEWWEFKKKSKIKDQIRDQWSNNRDDSDKILSLLNDLIEIHDRNKSQIKKVKDGYTQLS